MTGKEMPSSSKKPPRSTFSRIVWIAFIVAFIVVFALVAMAWLTMQKSDSVRSPGDASAPQQGVEIWQPNGAPPRPPLLGKKCRFSRLPRSRKPKSDRLRCR